MRAAFHSVVSALAGAQRVTVLTGAGVSAASGVPTFRDADGLWNRVRVEDLATPEAFARDPALVWQWYDWRRQLIAACSPNSAHHVLTEWSLRFPAFTLITQNVDGLHERAGTVGALRLHGSIWDVGCWRACSPSPHRWLDDRAPFPVLPPPCPHCGGPLRPGVVWFGEVLDADVMEASLAASACDVFLTIGTSAVVYPAAGLVDYARREGSLTVEINPDATGAIVDMAVAEPAELVLPRLEAALGSHPLTLETNRLRLDPVLPRDTAALHQLWTDPDVRRYLWDDEEIPLATAAAVTSASAHDFAARRFGLWTMRTRGAEAGAPVIGFCGLRSQGIGTEPELLFGLLPAYWGRGLVREAARAVIDYAFGTLHLRRIVAATDVPNERSARTLTALGMTLERRGDHQGLDTLFYGMARQDG